MKPRSWLEEAEQNSSGVHYCDQIDNVDTEARTFVWHDFGQAPHMVAVIRDMRVNNNLRGYIMIRFCPYCGVDLVIARELHEV